MTITLRPFEAADYDAALHLWQTTPGVELSDANAREPIVRYLRRNPGSSFVAIEGGTLVGTILGGHDGRRGLIHHLATVPAVRRRGVARALVRATLAALRAQGIDKCHLMVLRGNGDGLAFWRAIDATERVDLTWFSMTTDAPA